MNYILKFSIKSISIYMYILHPISLHPAQGQLMDGSLHLRRASFYETAAMAAQGEETRLQGSILSYSTEKARIRASSTTPSRQWKS